MQKAVVRINAVAFTFRYVVARGVDNGPITVWNITRGRCKGEAVSIERGLLDKNDVIVVKDVMVIILSDRGVSSSEEGAFPVISLKKDPGLWPFSSN